MHRKSKNINKNPKHIKQTTLDALISCFIHCLQDSKTET